MNFSYPSPRATEMTDTYQPWIIIRYIEHPGRQEFLVFHMFACHAVAWQGFKTESFSLM